MYSLPTVVDINGVTHPITNKGDYRVIIEGCFKSLNDPELDSQFRVISALYCFYDELNDIDNFETELEKVFGDNIEEAVIKMYDFFDCNQKTSGAQTSRSVIDWEQDAQLICSAINPIAPYDDIRLDNIYIHWFTFMGYYMAIGDCPWAQIVSIRNKIVNHKKLEKHEKEFKRENPEYFVWGQDSVEQKEAEQLITDIWNQG